MSYCRKDGKDDIIFVTKEDFDATETTSPPVKDAEQEDEPAGLILPNGDINWDCPCLQGMGKGPCGEDFKDAFSCFHYSEAEPKGSDCLEQFKGMQECFVKFPEVYGSLDDDDEAPPQTEAVTDQSETPNVSETVDQTETTNPTETASQTETTTQTETVDQTEVSDEKEAVDQTEVADEKEAVDQTETENLKDVKAEEPSLEEKV